MEKSRHLIFEKQLKSEDTTATLAQHKTGILIALALCAFGRSHTGFYSHFFLIYLFICFRSFRSHLSIFVDRFRRLASSFSSAFSSSPKAERIHLHLNNNLLMRITQLERLPRIYLFICIPFIGPWIFLVGKICGLENRFFQERSPHACRRSQYVYKVG